MNDVGSLPTDLGVAQVLPSKNGSIKPVHFIIKETKKWVSFPGMNISSVSQKLLPLKAPVSEDKLELLPLKIKGFLLLDIYYEW